MVLSFSDHVALLTHFLNQHHEIVANIDNRVLTVRGRDSSRGRGREYFEYVFTMCFFDSATHAPQLSRLKGQLAEMHVADGFEPVRRERQSRELDPVELVVRAYEQWDAHRWPGRNGRLAYAETLFAVFLLRQLEYLSLRLWDEGDGGASDRLRELQILLDRLNAAAKPAVFVRDARWLIQTAQGPLTRHLEPYFRIAERIAASFPDSLRLEIHKAGATLAGGHLRSQLQYRTWETGKPLDDPDVLATTRNSNSMDVALLVRDLVFLLDAYTSACSTGDLSQRMTLADAILQGLSADGELLVTRLDLLGPATMIEHLFIADRVHYTPMGRSHAAIIDRYRDLIARAAGQLREDAVQFDPSARVYSPFGIAYGFCADILSNMAQTTLTSPPRPALSLEEIFDSKDRLEDKSARAIGWAKLPKADDERDHFAHSIEWAQQIFRRLVAALDARATCRMRPNASQRPESRLYVVAQGRAIDALPDGCLPDGVVAAQEHCVTSDLPRALETGATAFPRSHIVTDRHEGRFLASAESDGKWFAVSKVVLTMCTSQGKDAVILDVPPDVVDVLRLACPDLVVLL